MSEKKHKAGRRELKRALLFLDSEVTRLKKELEQYKSVEILKELKEKDQEMGLIDE